MTARTLDLDRCLLDDGPARWSGAFVRKLAEGRELPPYGSDEWESAPWEMQVASAVLAGECWRRDGLFLAQRLADELAAARYWREVEDAEEFAQVARRVRALANQPTHAELVERRAA